MITIRPCRYDRDEECCNCGKCNSTRRRTSIDDEHDEIYYEESTDGYTWHEIESEDDNNT